MPKQISYILIVFSFIFFVPVGVFAQRGIQKSSGRDPFSVSSKKSKKIRLDRGLPRGKKQIKASSRKKQFSLSDNRNKNQNHWKAAMNARGVRGHHNTSADSFSRKSKKGGRSFGARGESFYKKKHGKKFRLFGGRRESRRMDKVNRKSFKRK